MSELGHLFQRCLVKKVLHVCEKIRSSQDENAPKYMRAWFIILMCLCARLWKHDGYLKCMLPISVCVCVCVSECARKNTRQSFIWNTYQQACTSPIFRNAIFFHAETVSTDGKGNCLGERVAVAEKSKIILWIVFPLTPSMSARVKLGDFHWRTLEMNCFGLHGHLGRLVILVLLEVLRCAWPPKPQESSGTVCLALFAKIRRLITSSIHLDL